MTSNKKIIDYSFKSNFNQALQIIQLVLYPIFAHLRISNKEYKRESYDLLFIIFIDLIFIFLTIKSYYLSGSIIAAPLISSLVIQYVIEFNIIASDIEVINRYISIKSYNVFYKFVIFFVSFIGIMSTIHVVLSACKIIENSFLGVVVGSIIPCFFLLLEMDIILASFFLALVLSSVNCNGKNKLRVMSARIISTVKNNDEENAFLIGFIGMPIATLMICINSA